MPAVVEFGFNAAPVFAGVDSIERKLRKMDDSVSVAHQKLTTALKNPWVAAGIDQQKYFTQLLATERQTRQIAAAHAKLASYKGPQAGSSATVNPWATAGAGQYAQQQDAAKRAAEAAAVMASQQRAAEAAAAAQQRLAAINAAAQSKAMAAAAAAATVAAAEQRSASLKTNNGRMNLALLESQIAGNKKEAASIQQRISLMERMRTIQQQTNVSQREAYTLAQRSAGVAAKGGGGRGFGVGMAAMQMQDVAVQMQMGTKMSTIVAQQGSQLLSIFGPAGMIVGGLVAVGGMFVTMKSRAADALQSLSNEVLDFDGNLQKLKGGSVTDMLNGLDAMAERAEKAREETGKFSINRLFAFDGTFDETGKANNSYDNANEAVATTNEQGRLDLEKQIVIAAEKQATLARLRLDGRDAEARKMERAIELAQAWQQIDQRKWASPEAKEAYTKSVENKLAAEQQLDDKTVADQKKEEMNKIADAQTRLDAQKKDAALDQMSIAQRIAVMSVDAQKALAEENRLKGAAKKDAMAIIDAEGRRVAIQAQILSLQKQLANEKKREADEAKRAAEAAAEAAKQAAAAASTRRGAVMDTALEFKMLEAKAAGRKKEIEQIEYQQRVMERSQRLQDQNGLGKRESIALAIKMTDMEDRTNGKRRKIRGVQGGDLDPLNRHGLSGRTGPLHLNPGQLAPGGPMSRNGGLTGFWNHQMGNVGQLGPGPSHYMNQQTFSPSPSLQATHQSNAAAASAPGGGGPTVDVFLEKLISRLPPALAAAILSQT